MTADMANIVLEQLRYILMTVDRTAVEVQDLKMRVSSLERSTTMLHLDLSQINCRLDGFDKRLGMIEQRLDWRD